MKPYRHDEAVSVTPHDEADYDVAIVGAGMVGATLALLLGRQGLRVALVDPGMLTPQWQSADVDDRVSALTEASRQLFVSLELWDAMAAQRVTPYTGMTVWDSAGNGEVCFAAEDVMAASLGHIVENSVVTDVVHQAVQAQPEVDCWMPARVTALTSALASPRGTTQRALTLDDRRTFSASLVVAADGARSPLRRMAGVGVSQWDTHQAAIVTLVSHALPHRSQAQQVFLPTGPLAFLPIAGPETLPPHLSSIVWSADIAEADRLMALDDKAFEVAIGAAFEQRLGAVNVCKPRQLFPLQQRHAQQYGQASLALVGDAAHSIHPLAGQGVNLGLLDAAVLAEELARAEQRGAPLGDQRVLQRYEQRRRTDNTLMLHAMEAFCRGFARQPLWLTWLRNSGLRAVDRWLPLKRFFIRQALGAHADLPQRMQSRR